MSGTTVSKGKFNWRLPAWACHQSASSIISMAMAFASYLATGSYGIAVFAAGLIASGTRIFDAAIDPFLAKIPANHAKYYPIYAKCCEFDIPVVISTGMATLVDGADPEHCHPRYIDAVARDFPKLKIVVSHGCYPWVNEIIMVVQRNRNVYLELSEYEQSPFSEGYIQAANTMIGDKVIFASAHPFLDFKGQIALYRKLPFSPQALENIFYNNAAKLLGL